jgi:hypothetical protein
VGQKKMNPTPKSLIYRELLLSLQDMEEGRLSPSFATAAEGIHWLNASISSSKTPRTLPISVHEHLPKSVGSVDNIPDDQEG